MNAVSFRIAGAEDEEAVLAVFAKAPAYFMHVEGRLPTLEIVRNEMYGMPEKPSAMHFKEFLLILIDGQPAGAVEMHFHHPQEGIAYIGLFLLIEEMQGRGLGRTACRALEKYASEEYSIKSFRLAVSDDQEVSDFWRKQGFAPNGHSYDFQGLHRVTHSVEYEKSITAV